MKRLNAMEKSLVRFCFSVYSYIYIYIYICTIYLFVGKKGKITSAVDKFMVHGKKERKKERRRRIILIIIIRRNGAKTISFQMLFGRLN
jgi:hypothetical protein